MRKFTSLALLAAFVAGGSYAMAESINVGEYAIDFSTDQTGWTAIDNESPGFTWEFRKNAIYNQGQYYSGVWLKADYTGASDNKDYYVSPAFHMEQGNYVITVKAGRSGDDGELKMLMGTSATDMDLAEVIYDSVPLVQGAVETTGVMSVGTAGDYYIIFQGVQGETIPYGPSPSVPVLMSFSIANNGGGGGETEPSGVELPYSIDLTQGYDGWSRGDLNADGYTWTLYPNAGMGVEMGYSATDDALVSPYFDLTAGRKYKIDTTFSGMSIDADVNVELLAINAAGEQLSIAPSVNLPSMGENTSSYYFAPPTSGIYAIEVLLTCPDPSYAILYFTNFSIADGGAVEVDPTIGSVIFNADLQGSDPMNGWTAIDLNADATTWKNGTNPTGIAYNGTIADAGADDWLITPAINFRGDVDYLIDYTLRQTSAFDADLFEVYYGTAPTAEAMVKPLNDGVLDASTGAGTFNFTNRLTGQQDGTGYIGIRLKTADANGKVTLTAFKVTAAAQPTPARLADFNATSNFADRTITASWTAPSVDSEGIALATPVSVKIYQDGVYVATVDNQNPGEQGEYTWTPEVFGGYTTIAACAVIGANESPRSEKTINLDDFQGDASLAATFPVSRDSFSEWYTHSTMGTGEWKYGYSDRIMFDYKMGQTENDWLITPGVYMDSDARYFVTFQMQTSLNYGASFDVTLGDEQNYAAQTRVIESWTDLMQNGMGDFETPQFDVETSGNYYIGFHLKKTDCAIYLANVNVYRLDSMSTGLNHLVATLSAAYDRASQQIILAQGAKAVTYDLSGRLVAATTDLSFLPAGIYIVKVTDEDGNIQTIKIAK